MTKDEITPRSGLAVYSEFLRGFGAWSYIEPLMLMTYGGGRHIEDLREVVEDKALRRIIGMEEIPSALTVGDWLRRMGSGRGQMENYIKELKGGFGM